MLLIQVKNELIEAEQIKLARIIVALISMLGIREIVRRMLN